MERRRAIPTPTAVKIAKLWSGSIGLDTREIKLVELLLLPVVKEKDILIYKDNYYMKDDKERRKRLKLIEEKLNKLKNINKNV